MKKKGLSFESKSQCPWCFALGMVLFRTSSAEKRSCAKQCGYYAWFPRADIYGEYGKPRDKTKKQKRKKGKIKMTFGEMIAKAAAARERENRMAKMREDYFRSIGNV